MSLKDKSKRLFEYLSQVYSIDLPVDRDVRKYGAETWWQADLIPSQYCYIKEPDNGNEENEENQSIFGEPDAWLSVTKRSYDDPPKLSENLSEWVILSKNPLKQPAPKQSIVISVDFDSDEKRVSALREYRKLWQEWRKTNFGPLPPIPDILKDWVDPRQEGLFLYSKERIEIKENFEDSEERVQALKLYVEHDWTLWAEKVLPLYKANIIYDQLFSLYQRLSIEGDRIEIIWGHLFLSWNHKDSENIVYHPLIVTSMNLSFDPLRRNISLSPSQTTATGFDIDCLRDLDYPNKDKLIAYVNNFKDENTLFDVWNNQQMRGMASYITGLISNESAEKTNLYKNQIVAKPPIVTIPTIYNAPIIFIRERRRRLWVEDAKQIASAIENGMDIPPFIRALVADPQTKELPDPDDFIDSNSLDIEGEEHMLPLEYNEQQKEIVERLKKHFGVLVQGPPGTGKSHTIANIVSSLLARGKRVLVTSQTENALKVLRGYIPEGIRSLCVSQLGNDTEAKRQLKEAVDGIGERLGQRGNLAVENNIRQLGKELRNNREKQAKIRNLIKDWTILDSENINLDGEQINAHKAAKECAENEIQHSWFPDKLMPDVSPLLTDEELNKLCTLIQDISEADRHSCKSCFPVPSKILPPDIFTQKIRSIRSFDALILETEKDRGTWGNKLKSASNADIKEAIRILKDSLEELTRLNKPWQRTILQMIATDINHVGFWRNFYQKCNTCYEKAVLSHESIQGFNISITFEGNIDVEIGLEELTRAIEKGKDLSSWLGRIGLSKQAKHLLNNAKIDNQPLHKKERVLIAQHHLSYHGNINKIKALWDDGIKVVDGPSIDISTIFPVSDYLKKVQRVLEWFDKHYSPVWGRLRSLGCRPDYELYKEAELEKCIHVLEGQLSENEKQEELKEIEKYYESILYESQIENSHPVLKEIAQAIKAKDIECYTKAHNEFLRLLALQPKVKHLELLAQRLRQDAPEWYQALERKSQQKGPEAIESDWRIAWRWQRLNRWLLNLHNRESVESLQNRLERLRTTERELLREIVIQRTWQIQVAKVEDHHYLALIAWSEAMKRYGKGKGKYAQKFLNAAGKAMIDAVGAVPAWIMPLHRVIQSFPAKSNVFDVIITDESSQCDLRALQILFRAQKILVVGDPEQISPSNVGIERDKVYALMKQYLFDIPYYDTKFHIDISLYDIAKSIPRMNNTLLTEHFRCVPDIIEFNNHLCPSYNYKLEPLRQPNPGEKLDPAIQAKFIENGFKEDGDINKPEAEELVEMLIRCCQDERYLKGGKDNRKRTMGVISLLGENQAKYISQLIAERLDETERAERQIVCGDAYAFQGDERDVMFLSMVIATNAGFAALTKDSDRQRFNVATSRARDQVFLFHSVRLDDIRNEECVRYKLLRWYQNPPLAEIEAGMEILKKKAESPFELEVGERIIRSGYKIIPQLRPFPNDRSYRIDLVVQGEKNRIAVECDGERWHGPERWESDQRREAQLRRAGWKFWRINGSAFYRNKEKSLEALWDFLKSEGIEPIIFEKTEAESQEIELTIEAISDINIPEADRINIADDNIANITEVTVLPGKEYSERIIEIGDIVRVYDEASDRKYIYKIGLQFRDKPGYVNPISPVGRVLLGCKINDIVEVEVPGGLRTLEIVDINN
jgi:transcription elongation GreA/GreB family factor